MGGCGPSVTMLNISHVGQINVGVPKFGPHVSYV